MKLPDFSTFAPLNENREQMNAELPTDLSFVKIEDRLNNADLERKERPKSTSDETSLNESQEQEKTASQFFIPAPASILTTKAKSGDSISRTLLIVQLSLFCNFCLVSGVFYVFGAPWEKNPPVQYIIHQTVATPAVKAKGKGGGKLPPAIVKPHQRTPTEPFYRRHEYVDQYGRSHTIIEQIPAKSNKH
jgi:hypothetical protein